MMPERTDVSLTALLNDTRWMRSIARGLVNTRTEADDLVQEAAVTALRKPPARATNVKGWLRTVMRNAANQRRRGDSRRAKREACMAVDQLAEPTDELVARTTLRKHVAECALTIAEPYRTAILMRYFEDMTPNQIAQRRKMPVATVHTHLSRGLDLLRRQLDQVVGQTMNWRAVMMTAPAQSIAGKVVIASVFAMALTAGGFATSGGTTARTATQATGQSINDDPWTLPPPSGDAELDELRRLAVVAPIDELFENRLYFGDLYSTSYRHDNYLATGIERMAKHVLTTTRLERRRHLGNFVAQFIEYGEDSLKQRLGHYVHALRVVR